MRTQAQWDPSPEAELHFHKEFLRTQAQWNPLPEAELHFHKVFLKTQAQWNPLPEAELHLHEASVMPVEVELPQVYGVTVIFDIVNLFWLLHVKLGI